MVTLSVYSPRSTASNRYKPASLVVVVRTTPVCTLAISTVAFGTVDSVGSVTIPVTVPRLVCAGAKGRVSARIRVSTRILAQTSFRNENDLRRVGTAHLSNLSLKGQKGTPSPAEKLSDKRPHLTITRTKQNKTWKSLYV